MTNIHPAVVQTIINNFEIANYWHMIKLHIHFFSSSKSRSYLNSSKIKKIKKKLAGNGTPVTVIAC